MRWLALVVALAVGGCAGDCAVVDPNVPAALTADCGGPGSMYQGVLYDKCYAAGIVCCQGWDGTWGPSRDACCAFPGLPPDACAAPL